MNNEMELLKAKLNNDLEKYAKENDIDKMYIVQTAISWIERKVEGTTDLKQKIELIENLLEDPDFIAAITVNQKIENDYENINVEEYAQEVANLIKKLRSRTDYAEISKQTGYSILQKFELPETYKEESLTVYKENVLELLKYIKEKSTEISKENEQLEVER